MFLDSINPEAYFDYTYNRFPPPVRSRFLLRCGPLRGSCPRPRLAELRAGASGFRSEFF